MHSFCPFTTPELGLKDIKTTERKKFKECEPRRHSDS